MGAQNYINKNVIDVLKKSKEKKRSYEAQKQ